jgi:general stress protein 26
MSTIESDMLGYEERGTVGDASGRSSSSASSPNARRRQWSPPDAETHRKLNALIKDIGTAMLTTVAPDGALRSRPMATQGKGLENGELWFFTADNSGKVAEIEAEHEVNLAYAEPKDQRYVSLSGRARVVRDPERARRLWNSEVKAWFPGGPEDPHLALLRVRVHSAEYWDAPSGKMAGLIALAKSKLTGESAGDVGEHGKVLLAH